MPGPTPTSMFVVALLSGAPETAAPSQPSKLVAAAPTPQSYPVPVIDVVKVGEQLKVQVRSSAGRQKVLLKSAEVKLTFPDFEVHEAASKLAPAAQPTANKSSPKLMTTVTAKMEQPAAGKHVPILMGKVTAKVEGSGAKIELLAAKIEGERVVSIGCDGAVTDGSATWRLEGPSAFAFPDGTQIHLQPGGKDGEGACANVDITSGNQHVHLRSKGSGVVISKPTKPTLGHKIGETGQKMATADGTYFIKLAPSAQPVEGKIAGWAVLENVDGQIRASGIVLKKGDGVTKVDYMKIEMKNVLVTSF